MAVGVLVLVLVGVFAGGCVITGCVGPCVAVGPAVVVVVGVGVAALGQSENINLPSCPGVFHGHPSGSEDTTYKLRYVVLSGITSPLLSVMLRPTSDEYADATKPG